MLGAQRVWVSRSGSVLLPLLPLLPLLLLPLLLLLLLLLLSLSPATARPCQQPMVLLDCLCAPLALQQRWL